MPAEPLVVSTLRIGSLNVQSLSGPKLLGIGRLMATEHCQVICLQETWSQGQLRTCNMLGKTYHSIGFCREQAGRGIGILIEPHLNFRVFESLCWANADLEILTIRSANGVQISNVYLPPNSSSGVDQISDLVDSADPSFSHWLIIGDFNANH